MWYLIHIRCAGECLHTKGITYVYNHSYMQKYKEQPSLQSLRLENPNSGQGSHLMSGQSFPAHGAAVSTRSGWLRQENQPKNGLVLNIDSKF